MCLNILCIKLYLQDIQSVIIEGGAYTIDRFYRSRALG